MPIVVGKEGEVILSLPLTGYLITVFSREGEKLREFGELVHARGSPFFLEWTNTVILAMDREAELLHAILPHVSLYSKYTIYGDCFFTKRVDSGLIREARKCARQEQKNAMPGQIRWVRTFLHATMMPDHSPMASLDSEERDLLYRFSPAGDTAARHVARSDREFSLLSLSAMSEGMIVSGHVSRSGVGPLREEKR